MSTEKTMTFSEAAKRLPAYDGKRVHPSTLWRWARRGCKGVKLETLRLGGRFVTSLEALERFGEALAKIDLPDRPTPPAKTATKVQRTRSIERAETVLAKAGIA